MRFLSLITLAAIVIFGSANAGDKGADSAYEPMTMFAALDGTSWRGEGTGPDGEPIVDIARYEMILDGRAFQTTHRLEGGTYGGRSIFFYDEGAEKYVFHYFTTAGFHTIGDVELTDTGFKAVEKVEGHPDYAEVQSEFVMEEDQLRVLVRYIDKQGKVTEGVPRIYREIENPGPLFGARP